MSTRLEFVHSVLAALAMPSVASSSSASSASSSAAGAGDPVAEGLFRKAKDIWRSRADVPYLAYAMRERYTWRDRPHETWWHAWYRLADRRVALQRVIIPDEESERLKGSAIAIHMRFHQRNGPTSFNLDTNPNADAFAVMDPLIEPIGSFGMLKPLNAQLVEADATAPLGTPAPAASSDAGASPAPGAASSAAPMATESFGIAPTSEPLHELARVEAVTRDYKITNVGTESLRDGDAYHLTLEPLRNPYRYRLRDLWISTTDNRTLQLATQGLFVGPPYDTARWIVTYTQIGGRSYVQEITTPDTLRFGPQHGVTDFAFDFVGYSFPDTVPETIFTKLL